MPPLIFSLLLLLLAFPACLTSSASRELEFRGQRTPRDTKQDSIKVVISEGCVTNGDSSDSSQGGKEIDLAPGSPLVLTHQIKLVPSGSGSGSESCGCEADFAVLRERVERLEREVSALREKCGGAEGGCCTTKESKGAGCSIKPEMDDCPNECSDQGRCVDGRCVCFPGFSGPDCSDANCPTNCHNSGKCINGQCVCDPGFSGPDCTWRDCPDNCSDRGRCINGRCACDAGFSGPSCSQQSCPGNCNNRGRCVDGQCMCDPQFTGPDCSAKACPGNCNGQGRCVNGQCVCDSGFTGPDCSTKACPNNCNNRGKCVNGKCQCDVGFAGPECGAKSCPNNCNNKGRCVKGRCVCRRGFTGPDCSQCEAGKTGPNCDVVMSGVTQLSTRDITETSVTLIWTPPPVQYQTYHITFTSQKESDQQITVQVEGSLTTYSQTGLAAGQEYTVTIAGETDGRMGAESSAEFVTLISGPSNLQVVKTATTSAVVQWEQSQGEIDRYRLTISPNDGVGRSQELTLPPDSDSAQIEQLEAGRLYDVILVAEKGTSMSEPAIIQATPGDSLPKGTMAAVTAAIMPSPGPDVRDRGWAPDLKPEETLLDQQRRREDGKELGSSKIGDMAGGDAPTTLTAKTKPLVSKKVGFKPRPGERPIFPKKPNALGLLRLNGTRFGPGGRKIGLGQLKKPPGQNPLAGASERSSVVKNNPKPGSTIIGDRTLAFTLKEPSIDATVNERRTDDVPVTVPPVGSISGTDIQSSYEEPTVTPGSTKQPEIAMATQGNNSGIEREGTEQPVSLGHNGTTPTAGKKCNRIKVTHIRLPHSDNDGGQPTTSTHHSSSETGTPPSAETKKGDSSDALFQLLTDTFDNLNIKTFSVHLSKPSDLSQDAETVSRHILSGMKPLSYSSSSPSSSFLLPSLPVTSPSSAPSSSENLDLVKGDGPEVDTRKNGEMTTEPVSAATHQNERFPQEGNLRPFRRTPPKDGYPLRPRPNIRPLQKRTQQNFRPSRRLSPPLSMTAETEQHHSSDFSSPPPSSNSEEPLSVEAKTPERGSSSNREETSPMLFETEQNQSKREDVPTPHDMSHNVGSSKQPRSNTIIFQNKTSPNQWHHRDLSQPSSTELEKDPLTPNELQPSPSSSLTSSFISEESRTISGNVPDKESEGVMSPRFKQGKTKLLRGGIPPNRIPPNKYGFSKRTHANMRLFPNRTLFNLRPPQRPAQPLKLELGAEKEEPFSSREVPSSAPSSVFSGPVEHPVPDGGSDGDKFGTMSVTVDTGKNQTLRESAVPPFRRLPSKAGYPRRSYLNMGHLQNRTHPVLRPPQRPQRGPIRRFNPPTKLSREQNNIPKVQPNQSGENRVQSSDKKIQIDQSQDQDTGFEIHTGQSGGKDNTQTVQTNQLGEVHTNHGIEVNQLGEEEAIHNARITGSDSETDIYRERVDPDKPTMRRTPPVRQSSYGTANRSSRPTTVPGRKPAAAKKTAQGPTQMKKNITDTLKGQDSKMGHHDDGGQTSKTEVTGTVGLHMPKESNVSPSGDAGEPLGNVGVRNVTSGGFTVVWDAPEGKYKKFVVTKKKLGGKSKQPEGEGEVEDDSDKKDSDEKGDNEEGEDKETSKGKMVEHEGNIEENVVPESGVAPGVHRSTKAKPATESDKTLTKVLPGSARSFQFENLPPQTPFTVTLLGKGPGLLSRLHKLVISTGPEPPSDLVFSEITENSLTVSWTKPKSPVSGFKVTYTHTEEGEPVSVSVGSEDSMLDLSQLTPGSTYEISVLSVLGLDESDALQDVAMTPPDPPTDLRALNVTDTKALLLWRPALAAIDKYAIVYSSDKGSEVRITVSGNAAEQQLGDLQESTKYTVTITSQLGDLGSAPATTTFTTTRGSGGDGGGPQDLQASRVTPRTTLLSWKPPAATVGTYKLTYQAEGQEAKEVTVDGAVTEYSLARLHPGSKYTVQLQAETGGVHTTAISTDFTTGSLRFPFPSDCSQELLNGIKESGEAEVFPNGKQGSPLMVYCDMETDGGGWTVFQRRKDGSVDFFKGWKDYAKGFGDLSGEFWLGLENLHILTAMSRMGLRVDLRAGDEEVFAEYSTFEVAKRNYKLTVAGYSGTAGDSMTYHNNRLFSTKDRDPMPFITRCAMSYRGGWWYKNCHEANLNGLYGIDVKHQGIIWTSWKGQDFSIPFTEMKMRPSAFSPPALG